VNVGTKQFGRGKRGIDIDTKEFMALRNLVHFYSPNPFQKANTPRIYGESGGLQENSLEKIREKPIPKIFTEDLSVVSNNGPMIYQKDLFMQVKQKNLANQLHVSLLDRSVLTYRSIAQMSEK